MKLNSDIIFDSLSQSVALERYGSQKQALELKRPLLYTGVKKEFQPNQLYVTLPGQLPADPVFPGRGTTIVCVGGRPPAIYLTGTCVCMLVRDTTDIFTVFNQIQETYDRFDTWESEMNRILETTADIKELLEASFPILENPMVVIGQDYHYLGYSSIIDLRDDLSMFRPDRDGKIKPDILAASIYGGDTNMSMTNPFCILTDGRAHFSINLFEQGTYAGNLKIAFVLRPFRESDNILSQYLAKMLEKAIPKLKDLSYSGAETLRGIFLDLLRGMPLSTSRRQYLAVGNAAGVYLCLKLVRGERSRRKVPVAYFCDHIESTFPGSVAFEYNSSIVAFLNIQAVKLSAPQLDQRIIGLLQEMNLKAGISNSFSDLYSVHFYYRQACIAFELGSPQSPEQCKFSFGDFALNYMLYSCTGEFPVDKLYPDGFRRLMEYDSAAQVNYLETLRVYLNNNMNIAKSAKDLFIHRTTFLERLGRIESLLGMDLKDPSQRLCLNIILKFSELRGNELPRRLPKPPEPEPEAPRDPMPQMEYQELETLL